jgi:hypothetical protein
MAQCVMPVGFIAPYTSLPVLLPARLDTFESLLLQITLADVLALAFFVAAWFGYTRYADR